MPDYTYTPYNTKEAAISDLQRLHGRASRDEPFQVAGWGTIIELIDTLGFLHARGCSYRKIAELLNLSYSEVRRWGRMADGLTDEAKEIIHNTPHLSLSHAREIAKFKRMDQEEIARRAANGRYGIRRIALERRLMEPTAPARYQVYYDQLAEKISDAKGFPCLIHVDQNGGGRLEFRFAGNIDFENLCDYIGIDLADLLER